jgi:hypothetical protein
MNDINPRAVLVLSLALDTTISNESVRECFDLVIASESGRGPARGRRGLLRRFADAVVTRAAACCCGCVVALAEHDRG